MEKEIKKATNKSTKKKESTKKIVADKKTKNTKKTTNSKTVKKSTLKTDEIKNKLKKVSAELESVKEENRNQKIEIIGLIKNNTKLKNILLSLTLLFVILIIVFVVLVNNHYKTTYHGPKEVKVINNILDNNYVFLGDSITAGYDLDKFYKDYPVINSGVGGYNTQDILDRLSKMVYRYNPSKVFLLIGTNDIYQGKSEEEIISNIGKIIDNIKEKRKYTEIYVESIYPINSSKHKNRTNEDINKTNKKIKELCKEKKVTYLSINELLMDDNKELKNEFTEDGLHLNDVAYQVITDEIKKYLD